MTNLLLENLAANQSFDAALRRNPSIDMIAAAFIALIMFEPDEERRRAAIAELESAIIAYAASTALPAARELGIRHARRILNEIGPGDLGDANFRQRVLLDLNLRDQTRLRIIQAIVNDKANTLENRLNAYWLEPGQTEREKLDQLRELHGDLEERRRKYESDLKSFLDGETVKKPRKPQFDFYSRFSNEVKQGIREQARRAGTDAEIAAFVNQGHLLLSWLTVNAEDACPDCRLRQGSTGGLDFWESLGRPGSGKTICGASCFCLLVPAGVITRNPDLKNGLSARAKPVITTPEDLEKIKRSRI